MSKRNNIPVVWQISALHLNKRILLSGVVLKAVPFNHNKQTGRFINLLKLIKSYFISAYSNEQISIETNNITINTNTNKNGSFSVIVDSVHIRELKVFIANNDKPLKILQTYPIVFQNTTSSFDVISDIDDTIIVSYTADFFRRIRTLAFTAPNKRKTIGFTQKLFNEFKKQDARIFYISKSESNLFGMLASFIEHNNLPKGHLFLTPFLKFGQLFNSKKGGDYKLNNIRFIIENTEIKNFVLFGDDSQKDMEVYTKIAYEFPKRILKIYIRQTKQKCHSTQIKMWDKLKLTGVPITYFNDNTVMDKQNEIEQLMK